MSAPRRSRGMVLIMAAAAVVLVGALAAAVTGIAVTAGKADRRAALDARLLGRAESGAEAALDALASGRPWPGSRTVVVPGGDSAVSARESAPGRWEIAAAATEAGRQCRVRIVAERAGPGRLRVDAWHSEAGRAPEDRGRPKR